MAEEQKAKGIEWAGENVLEIISLRKGNKARKGQAGPRDQALEKEVPPGEVGRRQASGREGWGLVGCWGWNFQEWTSTGWGLGLERWCAVGVLGLGGQVGLFQGSSLYQTPLGLVCNQGLLFL